MALALQIADSGFPSGAFAFSWGLERLARDGLVGRDGVSAWIAHELEYRWAPFDRAITAKAHGAYHGADPASLTALDAEVEASLWPTPAREGSRRAGQGLLAAVARLGLLADHPYARAVTEGQSPGHLSVAEGVVWASLGLTRTEALTAAGTTMLARLCSAAVRLNLLGALAAQRLRADLAPRVARLAEAAPETPSIAPSLTEIALMRHTSAPDAARLFAN
ncbi:MAG: urease accessory UreF family protein [Pseudomonadota bacterium]